MTDTSSTRDHTKHTGEKPGTAGEGQAGFRLLADHVLDCLWTMPVPGNLVEARLDYVSPSVMALRGFTPEEVMAQPMEEALTPESFLKATEVYLKLAGGQNPAQDISSYRLELEHIRKDGSTVWVECNMSLLRDPEGRPAKIIGVSRDISEKKRSLARLQTINDVFAGISSDYEKNVALITRGAGEVFNATCALYNKLINGKSILRTTGSWQVPPDYDPLDRPEGHICHDVILREGDSPLIVRDLLETAYADTDPNVKAYSLRTYIGCPVRLKNETVGSLCVVFQHDFDPSQEDLQALNILAQRLGVEEERRHAEEKLRQSETRLRTFMDSTSDLVFLKDESFRHLMANKAYLDFLDMDSPGLIGKTDDDLLPGELAAQCRKSDKDALDTGSMVIFEESAPGHVFQTRKFPVQLDNGKTGVGAIIRDVTELRQRQEYAAEQEKLALVGQVAGKMAHDFNNILAIMRAHADVALFKGGKDTPFEKTLKLILEQTDRGAAMTHNLMAFAKDQEPKQEAFDINEKVDLVVSLLKKELESIRVIRECKSVTPSLLADPGMVEHALVNLIQNSVHAMSLTENPRLTLRTYFENNACHIDIEDNGCGIPEASQDSVFMPSFTLKGSRDKGGWYKPHIKGTGYGMANVKKYIVDKHGGDIRFSSSPGKGTTFTISLPVIGKTLTRQEKEEAKNLVAQPGKRILLVEDEEDLSEVQYNILTEEPFFHHVDIATSGQKAMELFDENSYDLVSLDYLLEGMKNGLDIHGHIRKTDPDIPVIFISGNTRVIESIRELMAKDLRVDYLEKPCTNRVYLEKISHWLARTA